MTAMHEGSRTDVSADERQMQAADWVLRLHGAEVDEQTAAQWLEWCQADRANLEAFESIRALWDKFDEAPLATSLKFDVRTPGAARRLWVRPELRRALAASVLLAFGVLAAWFAYRHDAGAYNQTLSTAVGSLRRQTLPDGSSVEIGARSVVRVQLTSERRNIFVDEGEAFFEVAKDVHRPFVVQAGDLQVTALGTAFNIRRVQDRIVVTVTEGTVRVASKDTVTVQSADAASESSELSPAHVRAGAGHQVTYSVRQHSLTMTKVEPVAAVRALAWQAGRLEFDNEPLGSVIADINRYSSRPIVLDDELATLIFAGTVRGDAIDDWLRGLAEVFPVEVMDRGEQGIRLARRPAAP